MRPLVLLACVASLSLPTNSWAGPDEELTQAIVMFGRGNLDAALIKLDEAAGHATDGALLARIHRQRGIVLDAAGQRSGAVIAFLQALYFEPTIELSKREHRGEVAALFTCARAMADEGVKESAVEARWPAAFDRADWRCPVRGGDPAMGTVTMGKPPKAPTTPLSTRPLSTAALEPAEPAGIWSGPLPWIVVGAAILGGAITTGFVLSADDRTYGGSSGTAIVLSGAQ